jgi:signal transduction histidine kinase
MGARLVLAWVVLASFASVVIEQDNGTATLNYTHPDDLGFSLLLVLLAGAGLVVVVAGRAVTAGRLLLAMGVGTTGAFLAHAAAVAALVRGHDGPAVQALVWVATWLFVPAIGLLLFVPALWPEDKITSPLVRRSTVLAVIALGGLTISQAVASDNLDGVGPRLAAVPNPLGIAGLDGPVQVITGICSVALAAYAGVVLVDLVLRYRRSNATLRAQLRPMVLVVAGLPLALAVGAAMAAVGGGQEDVGMLAAGGVLVLGGLAFALVRTERAVQRGERAVAQRRRTVEAAEDERRKLRRDLHDGVGPGLAAVRLQLDAARQALPPSAIEAATRLARVDGTLTGVLEELRCIVDGLRPAALDELGLCRALTSQGLAVSVPGRFAPVIDVKVDPALPPLSDAVEVALVRVSGEALANAVRHGAPSRCTVSLEWQDDHAVLRVEDDGVGIHKVRPGHGLNTMRERVEELGGKLTVGPAAPRGTVVTAVIPSVQ